MYDNENAIIRMLRNGARGYLLKDTEPKEFKQALDAIMQKGFYYSELVTGKLIHAVNSITDEGNELASSIKLSDREIEFLKLICTEMTYREIAEKMFLSPRTIDGYRDALFEKLNIKTRTGLVIFAIKNNLVQL
jgi:two-component system, NarL family, invasion response regulator UvrY